MFIIFFSSGSYWRTLIAVIFALISFLANAIILQITNERVPRDQDPLPDLAFNISSSAHLYIPINLSDYLVVGQSFRIILLLFIHKYRYEI